MTLKWQQIRISVSQGKKKHWLTSHAAILGLLVSVPLWKKGVCTRRWLVRDKTSKKMVRQRWPMLFLVVKVKRQRFGQPSGYEHGFGVNVRFALAITLVCFTLPYSIFVCYICYQEQHQHRRWCVYLLTTQGAKEQNKVFQETLKCEPRGCFQSSVKPGKLLFPTVRESYKMGRQTLEWPRSWARPGRVWAPAENA